MNSYSQVFTTHFHSINLKSCLKFLWVLYNQNLEWWLGKYRKNTLHDLFPSWSSSLPVLYEVGHDDQVHRPVAQVERKEEQGKHVGCQPVKTQLELRQLCLKCFCFNVWSVLILEALLVWKVQHLMPFYQNTFKRFVMVFNIIIFSPPPQYDSDFSWLLLSIYFVSCFHSSSPSTGK